MKLFACCWSRQKDFSPALPSVPGEVLRDILLLLDRWSLDHVQFTCRRFLRLITERMSDVCLRQIQSASFNATTKHYVFDTYKENSNFRIWYSGGRYGLVRERHRDIARLFSKFMQTLRCSRIERLTFHRLVFTPELAALILQTPMFADSVRLSSADCAKLTATLFHQVLPHFSPTDLFFSSTCHFRACQISDEFIRMLSENRVLRADFAIRLPGDGGSSYGESFCVTDDAIVEFCRQRDVQIDHEGEQLEGLDLYSESFTKDLFKRLVEASRVSTRMRPLGITVRPICFEDEDLRDYAQHVSYLYPGTESRVRTYNFPCEHHGAATAMRLQIVLCDNSLRLTRARHDSVLWSNK